MTERTTADELRSLGFDALARAVASCGVQIEATGSADEDGLVLVVPGHTPAPLMVRVAALPSVACVDELAAFVHEGRLAVLVADQISAGLRAELNRVGVGWLDRRGHLKLTAPGMVVDSDVAPDRREPRTTSAAEAPVTGRSGMAAAAALLLAPDGPMSASQIARIAGVNASSVTRALGRMLEGFVVTREQRGQYRPVVPDLFTALAEVWPRRARTVRWSVAARTPPARFFDSELSHPGWAVAGARGAISWGANLVVTADYPLALYAPNELRLRQAEQVFGTETGEQVLVSVDPIGLVSSTRYQSDFFVPRAHPLFCALDLTATARDREELDRWSPPEGFARVW